MKFWKALLLAVMAIVVGMAAYTANMAGHGFSTRTQPSRLEVVLGRTMRNMAIPTKMKEENNPWAAEKFGPTSQPAPAQSTAPRTLTGVVTDTMCGATHTMKTMSAADCTRMCAEQGGYALVVGKEIYTLRGHGAELDKLAVQTVTVKGTVNGKTVIVESVAAAKRD